MNKSIIALAVAGVLTSGIANAHDIVPAAAAAPVFSMATVAANKTDVLRGTTSSASVPLVLTIAAVGGESHLADMGILKLELSGGAKFDAATLDTELVDSGFIVTNLAADDNSVIIASSTCTLSAGDTVVECPLAGNSALGTGVSFNLASTAYDLSGVSAVGNIELKASVLAAGGLAGSPAIVVHTTTTSAPGVLFEVQEGIVSPPTAVTAAASVEAQVASSFFNFASSAVVTGTSPTASVAASTSPADLDGSAYTDATGKLLVKLSGLPTGTKEVTVGGGGGLVLEGADDTGAPMAPLSGNFYLDGAGNGYAVTTADLASQDAVGTAFKLDDIIIEVTGADPVSATEAKIELAYLAGAADVFVNHTILEATTFATITRNGTSFTTNGVGPALKIKVTDMSGSLVAGTGGISLIAYDAAGTMISGSMTIPSLVSNSMVKVTGADLEAAYPGIKRADFSVASSDINASAQKINADGGINVNSLHISSSTNANGAL